MTQLWKTNFNDLKERRGLSFRKLAKATGLALDTISKVSQGGNVQLDTLVRVCLALGCTLNDLIEINRNGGDQNELFPHTDPRVEWDDNNLEL
jgi:DNA-binding Xre family transcriptional regulator